MFISTFLQPAMALVLTQTDIILDHKQLDYTYFIGNFNISYGYKHITEMLFLLVFRLLAPVQSMLEAVVRKDHRREQSLVGRMKGKESFIKNR